MPGKRKIDLVIDANGYVSACISRASRHSLYYHILKDQRFRIFYSKELLEDFEEVIARPKFQKLITRHQVLRFRSLLLLFLKRTEIHFVPDVVRDADDNYLLGIFDSCQAQYLITGDKDLLVLKTYKNTSVVSMGQFIKERLK